MSGDIERVLVTGGAGFIGSHIVDSLLSGGYQVGVLDNLATGDLANLQHHQGSFELHRTDLRDWEAVRSSVRGYDAIMHQGALVSVTRSVEDPLATNGTNVTGTVNVLRAAVDSGVRKVVYASSSSVYGETDVLPKREDLPTRPVSPYAVSKLAGECYCVAFAKVYGLKTVSLRYFNVYGPRQKPGPYSGVIPGFIKAVQGGQPPIIFGDGNQSRDFTFVDDVVQANLLGLTTDLAAGEVMNIGAGNPHTVNELAKMVLAILDRKDLSPVHEEGRSGDVRASYADIGKAARLLGYRPRVGLEDGLRRILAWSANREGRASAP